MSGLRAFAWVATGLIAIVLLTAPVSVQAQLSLAVAILGALLLLWRFGGGPLARQSYLALSSFIVIRYVYWRATCTLPPASDPIGFAFGLVLLAAELYCVVILAISLIVNIDPLPRRSLGSHDDEELPGVDVFIPTYNEDEYILATTTAAALSMDYPRDRLNVWLLDDGGTDQKCDDADPVKAEAARLRRASLQALCRRLGAHYLTRARNEHAKAGNMNSALAHVTGDIVVVFDADHAPFRSFLRETVGYFLDDPKLFLVQTPHVFLNPDPIEKNLRTFDRMPSENEMFYSMTQRGLDKWDASFFCGSAALLRRAALMETGGFSGVTITEDCETAFELHARGYSSLFVDKPLIAGLQPETFSSFIGQRVRWCQGMLQILLLKTPLFKKGLKPIQKLGYLSSILFWFFPFPRLVFMLAPLAYILLDVKIFISNVDEAVAFTATYMFCSIMLQNYLFGRVRWPWMSELYEYCQSVFLSKAILSTLVNPRKPAFNVTMKGVALETDYLSELSWPFFVIYLLLLAGSLVAGLRYVTEPGVSNLMFIVGVWNTFNLVMAGAALGAVAERRRPDRHPRLALDDRAGWLEVDDRRVAVEIANVSAGGCALRLLEEMPPALLAAENTRARLFVDAIGPHVDSRSLPLIFRRVPAAGDEDLFGCEFCDMHAEDYFVLADLMYGDAEALQRFLAHRRKHKGILAGTAQFVWWGLVEPLRALAYLLRGRRAAASQPQTLAPPPPPPQASTAWLRRLVAQAGGQRPATAPDEEDRLRPAAKKSA